MSGTTSGATARNRPAIWSRSSANNPDLGAPPDSPVEVCRSCRSSWGNDQWVYNMNHNLGPVYDYDDKSGQSHDRRIALDVILDTGTSSARVSLDRLRRRRLMFPCLLVSRLPIQPVFGG